MTGAEFHARERFRPAYGLLAEALVRTFGRGTTLDVGSGQGFLIDALLDCGVTDVRGVELEAAAQDAMSAAARIRTLTGDALTMTGLGRYDLVCCVEMAEHIAPERSEALVAMLVRAAKGPIFFTAATPFQPGVGHINCRPTFHWLSMFRNEGYGLDFDRTAAVMRGLSACEPAPWLAMNALVLDKEN